MKQFVLLLAFVAVVILAIQNRAALLFPFVHDGMTQSEVTALLGNNPTEGFLVKGLVGTGPAHQTWTYHYSFFGFSFGDLKVKFVGDEILKTKKAEQGA